MALVITRPQPQADEWLAALAAAPQPPPALAFPLLRIAPVPDREPLAAAWAELDQMALAMFVSANAVEAFFEAAPAGVGWPQSTRAGSTGPGTTAALRRRGLATDRIAAPDAAAGVFDSEALWQQIGGWAWSGRRVLVVRGEQGRDWLAERWRECGARVQFVAAYRRLPPPDDAATCWQLAELHRAGHVWHFSSSEAVGHLGTLARAAGLDPSAWHDREAWASHPRIGAAAKALGFGRVIDAPIDAWAVAALWWQRHGAEAR